jgi:hypothetical protein
MTPKLLIRIAAGLVLFFAFGHTVGHTTRHQAEGAQQTVVTMMQDVRFDFFRNTTSYDGMYNGMSLNLIFTLIAFALVLWFVSNVTNEKPKLALQIVLPIALCVFGFAVTSFLYFFLVPAVTCLLASLALTFAALQLNSRASK